MKGYMKLTAALAAFALLVVFMGLGTQNSVRAQAASIAVDSYLCSVATAADATDSTCDAQTDVTLTGSTGDIIVKNLDVAEVTGSNPRTVQTGDTLTMVQQFSDPNWYAGEIRAFTGNRIEITHRPTSGFAVTKTITIDNVDPVLVTNSPDIPLVVKGGVNITFSADITDTGSGYTTTVGTTGTSDIDDLTGEPGALVAATNGTTPAGGVRLVVAGNVVTLGKSNFTAIDDGWQVSAELGSTAIQNIGANVPWYFETRDRAGNTRRTSGSISLKGTVVPGATGVGGFTDARFIGDLPDSSGTGDSFIGTTMMKVTRGSASETVAIASFSNDTGAFTIPSLPPASLPARPKLPPTSWRATSSSWWAATC